MIEEAEEETGCKIPSTESLVQNMKTAFKHIFDAKLKEEKAGFDLKVWRLLNKLDELKKANRKLEQTVQADISAESQEVAAFFKESCRVLEKERDSLNQKG